MGAGRFICVALPLILTGVSLVFLLYATLAGVSHDKLELFRLDTRNFTISPHQAGNIADKLLGLGDAQDKLGASGSKTANITAADLGLADFYDVNLWGFCTVSSTSGARNCSHHQFDWASKDLPSANLTAAAGTATVTLPKDVQDGLAAFKAVIKATEIASVAALVVLAAQIVIGFFSTFSRAVSCLTWLVSLASVLLVGAAAALATALPLIVAGVVDGSAKDLRVRASIDKNNLALVWAATAAAMAASVFWIATVCCCKPDRRRTKGARARGANSDAEKLLPTVFPAAHRYAPLEEQQQQQQQQQQQPISTAYVPVGNRSDLAYEPYSHRV